MRIEVTRDDIRRGKRMKPGECAVALAVKRAMPHATDVIVCSTEMIVVTAAQRWDYHVNAGSPLATFITAFDTRPHWWPWLRPFTFELPLVRATR